MRDDLRDGAPFADLALPDQDGDRRTLGALAHPYVPTVVTLSPDLRVHRTSNGYWFWGRATAEDLRQDLRATTRELRPDWAVPA